MKKIFSLLGLVGASFIIACGADGAPGPAGPAGDKGGEGVKGDPGAAGKDGSGGSAAVGFVTPNVGLLDRTIEVTISGSGTKFSGSPKVDFGDGITVSDVRVLSATAISAKLTIAPNAGLGIRAVTVGGETVQKAFVVSPPVNTRVIGTATQGGVANLAFRNFDIENPFDIENLQLSSDDFMSLSVSAESNIFAGGAVLLPPLAKANPKFTLANFGKDGKARVSYATDPTALKVSPRTPEATTAYATPKDLELGADLATYFGKSAIEKDKTVIIDYNVKVGKDSKASPYGFLFSKGGTAKDMIGQVSPPRSFFGPMPPPYDIHAVYPVYKPAAAEDQYFILLNAGGTKVPVKFGVSRTLALAVDEVATPHVAANSAQDLGALEALPATPTAIGGKVIKGELKAADELDVYKLTVAKGDIVQVAIGGEGEYDCLVTPDGIANEDTAIGGAFSPAAGQFGSSELEIEELETIYVIVRPYEGRKGKYTLSVRKYKD